jgi:hypothetical protein
MNGVATNRLPLNTDSTRTKKQAGTFVPACVELKALIVADRLSELPTNESQTREGSTKQRDRQTTIRNCRRLRVCKRKVEGCMGSTSRVGDRETPSPYRIGEPGFFHNSSPRQVEEAITLRDDTHSEQIE